MLFCYNNVVIWAEGTYIPGCTRFIPLGLDCIYTPGYTGPILLRPDGTYILDYIGLILSKPDGIYVFGSDGTHTPSCTVSTFWQNLHNYSTLIIPYYLLSFLIIITFKKNNPTLIHHQYFSIHCFIIV